MKLLILSVFFSLLMLPTSLQAMELGNLQLQGSGTVHYMGFIKVYDAQLYTDPATLSTEILSAQSSRCLKLEYAVSLRKENFIEAAEKILRRQHAPEVLKKVRPHLDLLHDNYQAVKDGDIYTLCYNGQAQTTSLILNGAGQVEIQSADFAAVYFGIWLGEKEPLSEQLRSALLSGLRKQEG